MTFKELASEVERLSQEDLLQLLEVVTRTLRASLSVKPQQRAETPQAKASSLDRVLGMLAPDESMLNEPDNARPFESLRGVLKPVGAMLTDEELKEDYTNYLIEKYT